MDVGVNNWFLSHNDSCDDDNCENETLCCCCCCDGDSVVGRQRVVVVMVRGSDCIGEQAGDCERDDVLSD